MGIHSNFLFLLFFCFKGEYTCVYVAIGPFPYLFPYYRFFPQYFVVVRIFNGGEQAYNIGVSHYRLLR